MLIVQKIKIGYNFINFRNRIIKNTSEYGLAKSIVDSYNENIAPSSILSFNAELLL